MYYCCKGCQKCCSSCGKCMDDCCNSCCSCCSSCCESFMKCISQCFSRPFSFCAFIASFITFLPTILMIVALIISSDFSCEESMTKTVLLVQGINNMVNFLFCIYIVFSFGKKYQDTNNRHGSEEKNILQRTVNMIMYDFVVCFYVIALIFFIVWVSIGHSRYNDEPLYSECYFENNGFLMNILMFNLISMDVFLIGGSVMFVLCLIIAACDEGSCGMYDICRCLTLCCTCGCWDIGKREQQQNKSYNPNRMEFAQQNRQNYSESRTNWLDKSKRLLAGFGLDLFSSQANRQQQNPLMQQPQNVSNNNPYSMPSQPPILEPNPYLQQHQNQSNNNNSSSQQQQQQQQYPPANNNPLNPYLYPPASQNTGHQQFQQQQYPPAMNQQYPPMQHQYQPYPPQSDHMMYGGVPSAPPPASQYDSMQGGVNPQQIIFDPHANQNPYANPEQRQQQAQPKQEKGLLEKAKDAATNLKDKIFK